MSVILPGSYDPVTVGHLDIIRRAAQNHETVYAVVFQNSEKEYTFSFEQRVKMLRLATEDIKNVIVDGSLGFVVDYMRNFGIEKIIKGYRNEKDVEYEMLQAEFNKAHGGFETELYECSPEFRNVSSTLARERIISNESLEGVLPKAVAEYLKGLE